MPITPMALIGCSWDAVALVWLIGLAFKRATLHTQPGAYRLVHLALGVLGFTLLSGRWFRSGWLALRWLPDTLTIAYIGAALTVLGCLFAIRARVHIGANWSGRVSLMAGHELVTTGPYAIVRHPIYTGILTAVVGTALAGGELRGLVAIVVILLAFLVKISHEEKLMMVTFPQAYPGYRERAKALIPWIF